MKHLLLSLMFLCNTANAASYNLVDYGTYTLDQNSGLEWLDTSFTQGKSYNQVLALLGNGQALEGWRYASYDEFKQIFTGRGYSLNGTSDITAVTGKIDNDHFFITLIDLLGATDTGTDKKDLLGLTAEDYKNRDEDSQLYGLITSTYDKPTIYSSVSFGRYNDDRSAANLASFLVRVATPVPEPESISLLFAGLMFAGWRARKYRSNRAQ